MSLTKVKYNIILLYPIYAVNREIKAKRKQVFRPASFILALLFVLKGNKK